MEGLEMNRPRRSGEQGGFVFFPPTWHPRVRRTEEKNIHRKHDGVK